MLDGVASVDSGLVWQGGVTAVRNGLEGITGAVADFNAKAAAITGSADLNEEAKGRMLKDLAGKTEQTIDALLAEQDTHVGNIISVYTAESVFPAPESSDAVLTEVQRQGDVSLFRMRLDGVDAHSLPRAIAELAAEFAAEGNMRAVHMLAATPWAKHYMKSRGTQATQVLDELLAKAVAPYMPEKQRKAAALLHKARPTGFTDSRVTLATVHSFISGYARHAVNDAKSRRAGPVGKVRR